MKIPAAILVVALAFAGAVAAQGAAPPAAPPLRGEVLEVLDGGAFTYLRLLTPKGEIWAVVRGANVVKGTQVAIEDPELLQNFESKSLRRTFDFVVFGNLAGPANAAAPASASAAQGMPHPGAHANPTSGRGTTSPDAGAVIVAKAEGANARTVAEVNADRLVLKDRSVTIRAQAVKVTPGVMGRNWIHLRDGSGSPADGSNDIVATSKEEPTVGDIVIATGVVKTDVNLGSGYAYKVLVEDASFRK